MNKNKGFTVIELLVSISILVIISGISVANFRNGEKQRKAALAADGLINAIRTTQNNTLTLKQIDGSSCANKSPLFYYFTINYSGTYTVNGTDNCNASNVVITQTLPPNIRVQAGSLKVNGVAAATSANLKFTAPYAVMTAARDAGAFAAFTTLTMTIEYSDGTRAKTVTVDGVSGKIE
jgi:prepilin-type N-terminal cleavage/methylation domain-containing protein/uncharacterized repeat protein (TIGR01451 family)